MANPKSGHKTEPQTDISSTGSYRRKPLVYLVCVIIVLACVVLVFSFTKHRNHSKYIDKTRNEQLVAKVEYLSANVNCKDALKQLEPVKLDNYTSQTQAQTLDYSMRCQALNEQYDKALRTGQRLDKIYIDQKKTDQQKQLKRFVQIIKYSKGS